MNLIENLKGLEIIGSPFRSDERLKILRGLPHGGSIPPSGTRKYWGSAIVKLLSPFFVRIR
jgi:hypothetical protein